MFMYMIWLRCLKLVKKQDGSAGSGKYRYLQVYYIFDDIMSMTNGWANYNLICVFSPNFNLFKNYCKSILVDISINDYCILFYCFI